MERMYHFNTKGTAWHQETFQRVVICAAGNLPFPSLLTIRTDNTGFAQFWGEVGKTYFIWWVKSPTEITLLDTVTIPRA